MAFEFSATYSALKNAIADKLLGKEELEKQFEDPPIREGEDEPRASDRMPGTPDGATGVKIRKQIDAANMTANAITFQMQQFIYASVKQMIEDETITGVEWELD